MIVKEDKCLFLLGFLLLALSEHAQYIKGVIFSSVQHLQYSTFNTDKKKYDSCFVLLKM